MAHLATRPPEHERRRRVPATPRIIRPPQWQPDDAPQRFPWSPREDAEQVRRLRLRLALSIVVALVVAFGGFALAIRATQFLLNDLHIGANGAQAATPTALPRISALPGDLTVAVGATQSFEGTAITVSNLQLKTANNLVGAPDGEEFAIVTIRLINTAPAGAIPYNAYDFVLADQAGQGHHEDFAALDHPLGAGSLAPERQVTGDIAFLVKTAAPAPGSDLQIVYLPSLTAVAPLRWSVSLDPNGL